MSILPLPMPTPKPKNDPLNTPAWVLGEIIGGNGLLAAATKLKITEATARTHANRILAKTGTTRQTELIRRFFEAALPGVPASAWNFQKISPASTVPLTTRPEARAILEVQVMPMA